MEEDKLPVFDVPLKEDIKNAQYPDALKRAIENVLNQSEALSAFQSFAQ